jgi:hypothetical protein
MMFHTIPLPGLVIIFVMALILFGPAGLGSGRGPFSK